MIRRQDEATMAAIFIVLFIVDILIVAISYGQFRYLWANEICYFVLPLCNYPHALMVAAVCLLGMFFVVRA